VGVVCKAVDSDKASGGGTDKDAEENAIMVACRRYVDISVCSTSESDVSRARKGRESMSQSGCDLDFIFVLDEEIYSEHNGVCISESTDKAVSN
jgi:hypothetical protein